MHIEGEKEKIQLVVDSKKKSEIMNKILGMDGVKMIDAENNDFKIDSLEAGE